MTTAVLPNPRLYARPGTYAGLFLVTLSTLMYEIALTRIFSVTMWYHFAFVAISVALLGLTAGALLVHLRPQRFRDADVRAILWRYSLFFSVSLALCFVTQLSIPFMPARNLAAAWSVVLTCAVISVPFVFSGVVVCLALTRFPKQVNRLYATDLVGAAFGCALLVVLFVVLDGPSLVIAIGAFAALAALSFAADARSRRGATLSIAVVVALGGFTGLNSYLHSHGHPLLRITWAKGSPDPPHVYEKWNAFSRVTVDPFGGGGPQPPWGFGLSARLPRDVKVEQLGMVIDSTASTVLTHYDGKPGETDFLRYDVTNLAHQIRHNADVLVVGVGGGRDILSALEFGQRSVTGVEINGNVLGATNGKYGDFTGHLDRNPRVRFVNDEARSYLARTHKKYDVIQISLIDTWAASSAGAYSLTENSLYTTQAWDVFFRRLKPGGVLSVSRWYRIAHSPRPIESYRTTALAAQALKNHDVARPRDHLLVYRGANVATVLVDPWRAFSRQDVATLKAVSSRLGFEPLLTPTHAADRHFAELAAPEGPAAGVREFKEDISPPTDNRPFFFQTANLGTLLHGAGFSSDQSMRPVLVLGLLALAVLGLSFCFIVLPLLLTTERRAHRGMFPFYTYFAGIGFGFLFIELSQLQRLTIFRPADICAHGRALLVARLQWDRQHGERAARGFGTAELDARASCSSSGRHRRVRDRDAERARQHRGRDHTGPDRHRRGNPHASRALDGNAVSHRDAGGLRKARGSDGVPLGDQRRDLGLRVGFRGCHRPLLRHLDVLLDGARRLRHRCGLVGRSPSSSARRDRARSGE